MVPCILAVDMAWHGMAEFFIWSDNPVYTRNSGNFILERANERLSMFAPTGKMQERSFIVPSPCPCQDVETTPRNVISELQPDSYQKSKTNSHHLISGLVSSSHLLLQSVLKRALISLVQQNEIICVIWIRSWFIALQSPQKPRLDYRSLVTHVLFPGDERVAIRNFSHLFIRFVNPLTGCAQNHPANLQHVSARSITFRNLLFTHSVSQSSGELRHLAGRDSSQFVLTIALKDPVIRGTCPHAFISGG
jgi:hypothetical protein